MRSTLALVTGLALGSIAMAQSPTESTTQPATQPANQLHTASYGIGYQIGKQITASPVKLDSEVLIEGFKDSIAGKPTKVSEADFAAAMQQVQQQMMAAAQTQAASSGEKNGVEGKAFRDENVKTAGVTTTASGLQIQTLKEGTGESPKASDTVKVHYTGKLIDGTTFDSSVDRGQPISFPLSGVIRGWTEGLQLMKVGGKSKLVIPADLAYGPQGSPPTIPPNATLVFEVELLDIEKK